MVDHHGIYQQIPSDEASRPAADGPRFKVTVAVLGGFGLMVSAVMLTGLAFSISASATQPVSLFGSTHLRTAKIAIRGATAVPRGAASGYPPINARAHRMEGTALKAQVRGGAVAPSEAGAGADQPQPSLTRRILCAAPMASAALALCSELLPAPAFAEAVAKAAPAAAPAKAATYKAVFYLKQLADGTDGTITIEVHPEWAPKSAARFAELVKAGKFNFKFRENECYASLLFNGLTTGFRIPQNPTLLPSGEPVEDDPVLPKVSNVPGRIVFAPQDPATAPKSEAGITSMIINMKENPYLDPIGFAPFGEVVEGMNIAKLIARPNQFRKDFDTFVERVELV